MDYRQKHPETCLAKCLMILIERINGKRITNKYELELLIYSLKHERENIARGHLEKVIKDFKIKIYWYLDSRIFFDFVKKTKLSRGVNLKQEKVNLISIDKMLGEPLIVYLDRFYLWEKKWGLYYKYHYPHFIIVNMKIGSFYEIIDPDNGEIKMIESKKLSKAIISMRNHLWMSPQVIQVYK